jgi:hypothetical protein
MPRPKETNSQTPGGYCCGAQRDSRFCPNCGSVVAPGHSVLYGLLEHLQKTAEDMATRSSRMAASHQRGGTTSAVGGQAKYQARAASKWASWAAALKDLLDQQEK